ncbi:hypothetical protein [Psychroserpens ponticola]|uniref:DUF4738 domain-containing protein n=1 Tax=Psychroserpens ponticola TaxID=2932268 RepID=A0ABY7S104_9FLAO|nr:hypothetical protein [Psychroserpens ponticola]WCO03068.1 hypothetical protein MUN68_006140 [Psychroserpens ponticola]
MKKSALIILLIAIGFFSCDRRGSAREHLQNSISEFNKKHTDLDLITYYPESYTEVQTDSIISNTFRVSIKNYSRMDAQILMSSETTDKKTKIKYHRIFESEINIALVSKNILSTTINAEDFKNTLQSEFWNNATLEHVWVNQETSNTNEVNLGISFLNPKNKAYKLYELVVTADGKQDLNLIEEHS